MAEPEPEPSLSQAWAKPELPLADRQLWGSPSPSAEFRVVLVAREGSKDDTRVMLGCLSCSGVTPCACLCALHTLCLRNVTEEGAQSSRALSLRGLLLLFFECLLSLSGASPTQSSRISSFVYSGLSVLFLFLLFVAVTCLMLL